MTINTGTIETTIDIDGFERPVIVEFSFNEITKEVVSIQKIVTADTEISLKFILCDEVLVAHLCERITDEGEAIRVQAAFERAHSYLDEY